MSKVIYFGQYSTANGARAVSVAANTLMDYVINTVAAVHSDFTVVSYAGKNERDASLEIKEENGIKTVYLPISVSKATSKLAKWKQARKNKKAMQRELNKLVNDGDTVIAYHSLGIVNTLRHLRKKKKITLVLQVAEIYSDVKCDKAKKEKEIEFLKSADKYIFSSVPLNELINKENKPYAICMGTYKAENEINHPLNDGKHHIVYAGTFNPIKGGVFNAISAAEFLDESYHLHILGGGEEKLFKIVVKEMLQMSAKTSCEITYDGYLQGEEYLKFLQSCQVGLSTQNTSDAFSDTSFPSKVLVYLANGLRVVSGEVLPLKKSSISDEIFYYEGSDPRQIAQAIKNACQDSTQDGRKIVDSLNEQFANDLKKLINA